MHKITGDMLAPKLVRRLLEETREITHVKDIGLDGLGRAITQLEILNETLPQGCHDDLQ